MRALALTLETIAAQATTEGKVQAAAAYLASQLPDNVAMAARFLAGTPLPPGSTATNVGRATLLDLVASFAGADRRELVNRATVRGDLGTAVAELIEQHGLWQGPRLSLTEVAEGVQSLGTISSHGRHRLLRSMLQRCTPLEAKYLTKILLGSMRTGMQTARVQEAIALAFDQPLSAVRRGNMLLGDIGATAERAAAGTLAQVTLRAQRPVRSMLAHPCDSPAAVLDTLGLPLLAEDKYDGIRAQLHVRDAHVRLYSRALEDFSHFFPEIRRPPDGIRGEWILDGELVAYLDGRALSFASLQRRLGRNQVPLTLLLDAPVVFFAFDALRAEGTDLIDEPLARRKQLLERLPSDGPIRKAPWERIEQREQIAAFFAQALDRGNEGAVFKALDAPYRPGTRGRAWVKLKRPAGMIDVVVTGAEYGRGKRAGLLSDLLFAVRDPNGDLLDCGRAYSGLTDEEIRDLTRTLKRATVATEGALRRVRPEVILEIAFDEIRRSERHPSGYALRFPRIVRRRIDLSVQEISSVDDLERLCTRPRGGA